MKFGVHLNSQLTPEWRKQYLRYKFIKKILYDKLTDAPPANEGNDEARRKFFAHANEEFMRLCERELVKINLFHSQQLAACETKFNELKYDLDKFKQGPNQKRQKPKAEPEQERQLETKTAQQLKLAFSEFYLSLILLQNYDQLNATGFRKILKKHDKLWETSSGLEWNASRVRKCEFVSDKKVEALITSTEAIVIGQLEGGNRTAAMKRLRVPPLSEKQHAWTTFRLGLYLGCFLVLVFLICVTLVFKKQRDEPRWLAVRLFRGFLVLFANIWLMGLNMYGWHKAGVNHVLIFEVDPRQHLTYQSLMEIASLFCMLWALCVLGYLHSETYFSPLVFPLILMACCLLWLVSPLRTPFRLMFRSSRYWFLRHVFYCFTAPFHAVTFPDFWLADQMNSLVTFFLDMEYFVCFYAVEVDYSGWSMQVIERTANSTIGIDYATGKDLCSSNVYYIRTVVALLPSAIRLLQCLRRYKDTRSKHPHLTNAGKYSSSFFVVGCGLLYSWYRVSNNVEWSLYNPFFYAWVLSYLASFSYTFTWDVWMDWGLMDVTASSDNLFLRHELVYNHRGYYYFAIAQDFILRLGWVANVSQGGAWSVEKDLLMAITAPFEIFRRFVWNYFRLENEHVNNCGEFRVVRDISVKPLKVSDLEQVIDKMDGDVTHRGVEVKGKVKKRGAVKRVMHKISVFVSRPVIQPVTTEATLTPLLTRKASLQQAMGQGSMGARRNLSVPFMPGGPFLERDDDEEDKKLL